jgi:hypothetical protein
VSPPSDAGAQFPQVTPFVLGHRGLLDRFDWSVTTVGAIPPDSPPITVTVWRSKDGGLNFFRVGEVSSRDASDTGAGGVIRGSGLGDPEIAQAGWQYVVLYEMAAAGAGFPFTDWFWGMSFRGV